MNGYPLTVIITKYHLKGNLEGMTTSGERMGFLNWEDACDWAITVTRSPEVPYVVLDMINTETKTVDYFWS